MKESLGEIGEGVPRSDMEKFTPFIGTLPTLPCTPEESKSNWLGDNHRTSQAFRTVFPNRRVTEWRYRISCPYLPFPCKDLPLNPTAATVLAVIFIFQIQGASSYWAAL